MESETKNPSPALLFESPRGPTRELLERIADNLTRPIPSPAKPRPTAAQSWRTLKPGQTLRLKTRWFQPGRDFPLGTEFTVESVDSLGVGLTPNTVPGIIPTSSPAQVLLRWEREDWQATFERVTRRKKREVKT